MAYLSNEKIEKILFNNMKNISFGTAKKLFKIICNLTTEGKITLMKTLEYIIELETESDIDTDPDLPKLSEQKEINNEH